MRIVGYNILKGGLGRELLIAEVLRSAEPDVAILEEATDAQAVETIARLAGYAYFGSQTGCSVAFLSKAAPKAVRWHENSKSRSPFLELQTEDNIIIYGVHFYALLASWAERWRVREAKVLLSLTASAQQNSHVLIGDFNTIAPGDTINSAAMPAWLRWMIALQGGDVKRDAVKTLLDAGYVDAFRQLHPEDKGYSLPTPSPNTRLDYAFVPWSNLVHVYDCSIVRQPEAVQKASDHYPILIEIANA